MLRQSLAMLAIVVAGGIIVYLPWEAHVVCHLPASEVVGDISLGRAFLWDLPSLPINGTRGVVGQTMPPTCAIRPEMAPLAVELWLYFMFFGTAFWYLRNDHVARIAKRIAEGKCRGCGYDLRGVGTRCPECGLFAKEAEE